jgi:hypothetical protein
MPATCTEMLLASVLVLGQVSLRVVFTSASVIARCPMNTNNLALKTGAFEMGWSTDRLCFTSILPEKLVTGWDRRKWNPGGTRPYPTD